MASRLADLRQASEASQSSPPRPVGGGGGVAYKGKKAPHIKQPFLSSMETKLDIVGTFGKRLTTTSKY